jgi:S-disulfanyl-L-cysteine oxidoreductase SoxD
MPAIRFWLILIALLWFTSLAAAGIYFVAGLRSRTTPPSYFTTEQARAGSLAYAQHCASCHGAALEGANGPALVGEVFWNSWGNKTVNALYEYNSHWMPQGRGGTLSKEIYADTTAYILAQNGLPSGEAVLEPESARLRTLVINEAISSNQNIRDNASATTVERADTVDSSATANNTDSMSNADAELNAASGETETTATLASADLYNQNCARCHGEDGNGGIGPSLQNNPRLEDAAWTVRRIAIGGLGMPAYAYRLSDEQIANVTSYIRTNFENTYEPVTSEEVASVVDQLPETDLQPVIAELETTSLGQQRYTQLCTACHGLQGGGGVGPPLAGNPDVANEQNVITILLYGRAQMPGFAQYGNETIAAISSYIRTQWGNQYGTIGEAQVSAYSNSSSASRTNSINDREVNLEPSNIPSNVPDSDASQTEEVQNNSDALTSPVTNGSSNPNQNNQAEQNEEGEE